jgi:hypothetical protein
MTLPMQLEQKCLNLFDDLIKQGQQLVTGYRASNYNRQDAVLWKTRCATLLDLILPHTSPHRRIAKSFAGSTFPSIPYVQDGLNQIRAIKADYDCGLLVDPELLIRAELAADYLQQATYLLESRYHVPAAVLGGAVLEDALRKLCIEHGIPTETDKGKRRTIDPMSTDLAKAGAYNVAKAAEIRGWAALRNDAAHGEGHRIDTSAVERMIAGVRSFIGDYLK